MPKSTPNSVLCHVFKACRSNSTSDLKKWVANSLFDPLGTNKDCYWSDRENSNLDEITPLHIACKYWGKETVSILLEAGAHPSAKASTGQTPLMFCAVFDNAKAMKLLIQHGANLNATDADGFTALSRTAVEGRVNCMKLLLDAGADMEIKSNAGMTALQYANKWKETKAAQMLMEAGATTNDW